MGVCLTCTGALVPGDVVKGGLGGSPEGIPCTCQGGVSGGEKINGPERTETASFWGKRSLVAPNAYRFITCIK